MTEAFGRVAGMQAQARAANHCSNPACRQWTVTEQIDPSLAAPLGEAVPICALSPLAPRYDPGSPMELRTSADNAIWLCRLCRVAVDGNADEYTAQQLRRRRDAHDQWVSCRAIDGTVGARGLTLACSNCNARFVFQQGQCGRCGATIFWSATRQELVIAGRLGVATGLLATLGLCGLVAAAASAFGQALGQTTSASVALAGAAMTMAAGGFVALRRRALTRAQAMAPRVQIPEGFRCVGRTIDACAMVARWRTSN